MKKQIKKSLNASTNTGTSVVKIEAVKSHKVLSAAKLMKKLHLLRARGLRIGFTNGCFDCCHLGHLRSLQTAKGLCDILVVGVNSDKWIRAHKGGNRPIQDQMTRTELLAALECVDYVVVFGSETALPLVKKVRPDLIAKEGYPLDKWPEGRFVMASGGEAVTLSRLEGYSTTSLVSKIHGT